MARNKMEKEFSQMLGQREIQPSAASWDRLDAMLSAAEAQSSVTPVKRNFKWLYIAASFLGFLLVGTLFFKNDTVKNADPDTKHQVVLENQSPLNQPQKEHQPESQVAASEIKEASPEKHIRKVIRTTEMPMPAQHLADNSINHQNQSDPIINQKTNQSDQAQSATDDATVEQLLQKVQEKRAIQTAGAKVNARKLLLEVDSQAEEKLTPRQRALRALNRNYQQVKVAVENRNVEENH